MFKKPQSGFLLAVFSFVAVFIFGVAVIHAGKSVLYFLPTAVLSGLVLLAYLYCKGVSIFKAMLYGLLLLQLVASLYTPVLQWVTNLSIVFLPLLFVSNAIVRQHCKDIPSKVAVGLIAVGSVTSLVYQFFRFGGLWNYSFTFDYLFLVMLGIYLSVYYLLRIGIVDVNGVVKAIALSGMLFIIYVMFRYVRVGVNQIFTDRFGAGAVNVNPNLISAVLDMVFPVTLFWAISETRRRWRFFALALSFVYCVVMLMTLSRGSLPGLVLLGAYYIFKKRSLKVVLISGLCLLVFMLTVGPAIMARVLRPGINEYISNLGRFELYRSAYEMLKDNFYFFGIGLNNFSLNKYNFGFPLSFDPERIMSSHNVYMEIWLGYGLLALLGWVLLFGKNIVKLFFVKKDSRNYHISRGLLFALLFYALHGLFDSLIANHAVSMVLFVILACSSYVVASEKMPLSILNDGECADKRGTMSGTSNFSPGQQCCNNEL